MKHWLSALLPGWGEGGTPESLCSFKKREEGTRKGEVTDAQNLPPPEAYSKSVRRPRLAGKGHSMCSG